jgi:hypothetical protein
MKIGKLINRNLHLLNKYKIPRLYDHFEEASYSLSISIYRLLNAVLSISFKSYTVIYFTYASH